eukprot:m.235170 g.235170  ORF g.235170 m.235170 type:complete len:982 (-) comp10888_c0_seq12:1992-4937(-)
MGGLLRMFLWMFLLLFVLPALAARNGAERLSSGPQQLSGKRRILVTGAAGFIGFTLCMELRRTNPHLYLVGLDSFTAHDQSNDIKLHRALVLHQAQIPLVKQDLCDVQTIELLLRDHQFTDVVHLAAQAGTRFSAADPAVYVRNNVQCFSILLQTMRRNHVALFFSSSSSVYGDPQEAQPFSPSQLLQAPPNMYAATKQASELLARQYSADTAQTVVNLRLFTVYGPWNRPDMAVSKFFFSILDEKPLPLFQAEKKILRDFTFVGDTVFGIMRAMAVLPRGFSTFNLGFGRPHSIDLLVELLQQESSRQAHLQPARLPNIEVTQTWADTSTATKTLQFAPQVSFKHGIRTFVTWALGFRQAQNDAEWNRQRLHNFRGLCASELRFLSLARLGQVTSANVRHTIQRSRQGLYHDDPGKKIFVFFQGVDSPGGNLAKMMHASVDQLEQACQNAPSCIGFSTDGHLKLGISPSSSWTEPIWAEQPNAGLYIAVNIDVCQMGLHSCTEHSLCTSPTEEAYAFECTCHPQYRKVSGHCVVQIENEEQLSALSHPLDVLDMESTSNHAFHFFPSQTSPGSDLAVLPPDFDTQLAKQLCLSSPRCMGFTSNGLLKTEIRSSRFWETISCPNRDGIPCGLYVRAVNYCVKDSQGCPMDSQCAQQTDGRFECTCIDTTKQLVATKSELGGDIWKCSDIDEDAIHVVICVDQNQLPGLVPLLRSIFTNARLPQSIRIHLITPTNSVDSVALELQREQFGSTIFPAVLTKWPVIDIHAVDVEELEKFIHVHGSQDEIRRLSSSANFARFLIPNVLNSLSQILYLDVDCIVQGDVVELAATVLGSEELFAAVPRNITFGHFFSQQTRSVIQQLRGLDIDASKPTFNAGVAIWNLELWRRINGTAIAIDWMQVNQKHSLWALGTQPIQLLMGYKRWRPLDARWNVDGLGYRVDLPTSLLDGAFVLHWTGSRKPWMAAGLHKAIWERYRSVAPGG